MMNRLPLRPRQINTEQSHSKPKLHEKGPTQSSSLNQCGNGTQAKTIGNINKDPQSVSIDDNSEVIIEERRIGSDGEEHIVQRYIRGKLLGKGGFAKVYLCTVPENGRLFAVKIVAKENLVKPRARQKV
jgi:hypothetical protein